MKGKDELERIPTLIGKYRQTFRDELISKKDKDIIIFKINKIIISALHKYINEDNLKKYIIARNIRDIFKKYRGYDGGGLITGLNYINYHKCLHQIEYEINNLTEN
jgi:hypothetical protein